MSAITVNMIVEAVKTSADKARKGLKVHNLYNAARRRVDKLGLALAPSGVGNRKTAAVGTYRSVSASCPVCPYKGNGCYAQQDKVGMIQARADVPLPAHLNSVALALAVSAACKTRARIHVSGDFGDSQGNLDLEYLEGVERVARQVRAAFNTADMIGWSYTHFPESVFKPYEERLRAAGIGVRYSDKVGKNGAIIRKFDTIQKGERAPDGSMLIKCPAQLRADFACKDCKLCANGNGVVVFDPHGAQAQAVEAASPALAKTKAAIDAVKAELVEVA